MTTTATKRRDTTTRALRGAKQRRKKKKPHSAALRPKIDEVLRKLAHDSLSHCGDRTLDETITREVMWGVENIATSGRIEREKGPHGKRKCKHCEAGWAHKQTTKNSGPVHKIVTLGEGTDCSADVIGPFPRASIEGYIYMLVIIDFQTKYLYVRGLKDQQEMHEKFEEFCTEMKRLDKKYNRVHLGMSKLVTDSAMNLMSKTMKQWQRTNYIVDWQSAPYSQNQNYVESKIKHLFAGGIANMSSSGFPHMMIVNMTKMKAEAMNAHWVDGSDKSPLEARFGIKAHAKDFNPPGAIMYVYVDEGLRAKGEDHDEVLYWCGRPENGGGRYRLLPNSMLNLHTQTFQRRQTSSIRHGCGEEVRTDAKDAFKGEKMERKRRPSTNRREV